VTSRQEKAVERRRGLQWAALELWMVPGRESQRTGVSPAQARGAPIERTECRRNMDGRCEEAPRFPSVCLSRLDPRSSALPPRAHAPSPDSPALGDIRCTTHPSHARAKLGGGHLVAVPMAFGHVIRIAVEQGGDGLGPRPRRMEVRVAGSESHRSALDPERRDDSANGVRNDAMMRAPIMKGPLSSCRSRA
jgi:hypothetical protein